MQLQYTTTEEDYITLKLFISSQTPRVMKQANAQKYIGRGIFLILALITGIKFITTYSIFDLVVCIFSVCSSILYPQFNLWLYRKTASGQFKRIRKNSGGNDVVTLLVDEDELKLGDGNGQYTMKTSKILRFIEVEKYFFIQMQKEVFLMIPKKQIQDITAVEAELRYYSSIYSIPYIRKFDWSNNIYSRKSKL